ncbi:MAG: hypothetical protein JW732_00760 [Dehalococcoidia bacterium]|nr:hypothetical protein [Dehalococcoidia bacterium]
MNRNRYSAAPGFKSRWFSVTPLVITLMILSGCTQPGIVPPPTGREAEQIIEIKTEAEILHYQRQSLWGGEEFSKILESKKEFESEEVDSFENNLESYNKDIVNVEVKFDEAGESTIFKCDIRGAMYSANSYDFHWLLGDLPFDLYQFKRSEKELYYEGDVNGVTTEIRLIFPYTIAHCHEHVWPEE